MPLPMMNQNKINFTSLGCPRNLVDSEVMLGILLKNGYEVTEEVEDADYLVVNTCGFLQSSRMESKEAIEELLSLKKESAKLIVTGCMVSKHKGEIEEAFPGVHYLLGSGDVEGILQAVASDTSGEKIGKARSYLEAGEIPRMISTPSHYAYLKIAEGCRKGCAYCIIPKIKGGLKSKPKERVVQEFQALLSQGIKEVILIAQDLGDYGKDQGKPEGALAELLQEMLKVDGEYWLRLLYLYPDEIDEALIEVLKSDPRVLPYLDMPIQHINDEMLRSMRRHTNGKQIKNMISRLRVEIPDIHIRTSLIVGFPGETEEQFAELAAFLREYPLNHVGIFPYSREEGTPAGKMEEQIPEEVKQERLEKLVVIQHEVVDELNQKMVGRTLEVVVENYHPETDLLLVGRYFGQCPEIDGLVILNDWDKVERFEEWYLVEITESAGYDLIGRVLQPCKKSSLPLCTSETRRPLQRT
ncbi:MAG: Ribosomal protein S12 methylthiotransferase RimO [Chlamydiae bacterium]|nr:Ribosomal protein S12 methylthiotransferase RimO [Chlamydiota bacterium]